MAYQIIYTCTNKPNTRNDRSVPFGSFVALGDTDRNIGVITNVVYEHYHSSTKPRGYELRGRLVFGDGTALVSDTQLLTIASNVPKCINTFANLEITGEQWALLTEVQTLDALDSIHNNNGYYGSDLYWRATAAQPMRIIITFEEQPPVYYAPDITAFSVQRVNGSGVADDEGAYIATTMKLVLGLAEGINAAALRVYYAKNAYPVVGESAYIDLTSRIGELLSGVSLNPTILLGDWSIADSWYFAAVFTAGRESDIATSSAARAGGSLHISGQPSGGMCVCGYSTGTTQNPKFESHAPAYFYGGIAQIGNGGENLLPMLGAQSDVTAAQEVKYSTYVDVPVTFHKPFRTAPVVIAGLATPNATANSGADYYDYVGSCSASVITDSITANGCTIRLANMSATTLQLGASWMAIGTPT